MKENLDDNSNNYFDDDCLIKDEIYNTYKDSVTCKICNKILNEPMMCQKCQKTFCKKCQDEFKKDNSHKCEKPIYVENKNAASFVNLLKYLCKNCKNEIQKKDIKKHLSEGCVKNENPDEFMNSIFRSYSLKRLNAEEIKEMSNKKKKVNYITCKSYLI